MKRGLRPIILTCEDFAPLGWNVNQDPSDRIPEPHCCPGCHYEWDDRISAPDRLLPKPGEQPGRWNRAEAHVCCSLTHWLDKEGWLGETFIPAHGPVTFHGETHDVENVRAYLNTRTIDRDLMARLIRAQRAKGEL
jgi:hypothetical protein